TDAGIYPGDNFYRLRIRERSGMVYYSAVRRVFYDEGSAGFSFYPNPALHSITIYRKEMGAAMVRLTDITGKTLLLRTIRNMREEIVLPEMAPGVYFIRVNELVKKLVVR
ncbi:MAG: T9SS type A sorting domain-containing protein, partial [Chitinophagaceae bacterium]|nr:T9SS type A sorting domain-containing protein [Chitinophagaceae bacterium]